MEFLKGVKDAVLAAVDDEAVGVEVASRNRYIALGAGAAVVVAGYLYLRQVLQLNSEDRASQRHKTILEIALQPEHEKFLRDIAKQYNFKDISKPLRMIIDFANQEAEASAIFTSEHIQSTSAFETTKINVLLDKESHVEWLEKMFHSKGLSNIDQALAVVLHYTITQADKSIVFDIDRSVTRPRTGVEPSVILSIKS